MGDKFSTDTGGNVDGSNVVGSKGASLQRGGEQSVTNNFSFDEQSRAATAPPPTLYQTVNQLVEKVDQILNLIQGDVTQDIRGIRPRIREIEQRLSWHTIALIVLLAMTLAIGFG